MEHVCLAVLPVGEALLVAARELHGSLSELARLDFGFCTLALLPIMNLPHGGFKLHFVRVDNFRFLLKIERQFVVLRVSILPRELLLVVRGGHGGVRVPHESVVAPGALAI